MEVVVFHDLKEVMVNESKVLVWVGTQTYTIKHLEDDGTPEKTSTNTIETTNITSVNGYQPEHHSSQNRQSELLDLAATPATSSPNGSQKNKTGASEGNNLIKVTKTYLKKSASKLNTTLEDSGNTSSDIENNGMQRVLNGELSTNQTISSNISTTLTNNDDSTTTIDDNDNRTMANPAIINIQRKSYKISGGKSTRCDICNRNFSSGYVKNRHMLSHFGIKPYKCSMCDKNFAQSSSYYAHKCVNNPSGINPPPTIGPKRKRNIRLVACPEPDCGRVFRGMYMLKRHEITHTGEKPYKCDVCQKAFTQWTGRHRHKCPGQVVPPRRGSGVPCQQCGKTFKDDFHVQIHLQSYHCGGADDSASVNNAYETFDLTLDSGALEDDGSIMDTSDIVRQMFYD